jgi:hypothetical protein
VMLFSYSYIRETPFFWMTDLSLKTIISLQFSNLGQCKRKCIAYLGFVLRSPPFESVLQGFCSVAAMNFPVDF